MICLGLLAQHEHLTVREFVDMLTDINGLRTQLGRLQDLGLVRASGRTRAMKYFVTPSLLRDLELPTTPELDDQRDRRFRHGRTARSADVATPNRNCSAVN